MPAELQDWLRGGGSTVVLPELGCSALHLLCACRRPAMIASVRASDPKDLLAYDESGPPLFDNLLEAVVRGFDGLPNQESADWDKVVDAFALSEVGHAASTPGADGLNTASAMMPVDDDGRAAACLVALLHGEPAYRLRQLTQRETSGLALACDAGFVETLSLLLSLGPCTLPAPKANTKVSRLIARR